MSASILSSTRVKEPWEMKQKEKGELEFKRNLRMDQKGMKQKENELKLTEWPKYIN